MPHKDPDERREYARQLAATRRAAKVAARGYSRPGDKCQPGCTCGYHPDGMLTPVESAESRRALDRARTRKPVKPAATRKEYLRRIHRLTAADFAAMLAAQDGRCCYCERPLPDKPKLIHVDHDHTCTCGPRKSCRFCQRGLACFACNGIVGQADDDPDRLERIAANLRRLNAETRARLTGQPVQAELPVNVSRLELRAGGTG